MKSEEDIETLKALGRRVRDFRHSRSISQEALADAAAVHRTYIGMIERGEKNITVLTLSKIAQALELSVQELLGELKSGE